ELNERIRDVEQQMTEMRERAVVLSREVVDEREVARALTAFDPLWETLSPREQARVVQLLVKRVDYDGAAGTVGVAFHPNGLRGIALGAAVPDEEEVAA
ncbi:MAG: recombinase family protein, partial [Phycisphaerae bacterium]|nr:recombinase family protein [Phycisphaerae bacterium]